MSKIQTKEKIELRARLAKSRYEQSLKLVVDMGPVLPTVDRTILESEVPAHIPPSEADRSKYAALSRFMSTRLACDARLVGRSLFNR